MVHTVVPAYSFKGDLPRHLRGLTPAQATLWESYRERYAALGSPPPVAAVKAWGSFKLLYERAKDGSWQMSEKSKLKQFQLTLPEAQNPFRLSPSTPGHPGTIVSALANRGIDAEAWAVFTEAVLVQRPSGFALLPYQEVDGAVVFNEAETKNLTHRDAKALITEVSRRSTSAILMPLLVDRALGQNILKEHKLDEAIETALDLDTIEQDPHRGAAICESATYPDYTQVGSTSGGVSSARLSMRPHQFTPDQLAKAYSKIIAGMPGVYLKLSEASSEIDFSPVVRVINRLASSGSTNALLDRVETIDMLGECVAFLEKLEHVEPAASVKKLMEQLVSFPEHKMILSNDEASAMLTEAGKLFELVNRHFTPDATTRSFGDHALDLYRQHQGELVEYNQNHGDDGRFTTSDGASDYKRELMKAHTSLRTYKDPEKRARERTHSKREQKLFKRLWNTPEGTKEFKKAEKQWYRHIGQKNEAVARFRALLAENSGSRSCTLFHECNGSTACAPCMAKESRGSSCEDDDEDDKKYESASTCPECGAPMKDGTCTKCGYSSKTESILEKWNTFKATKALGTKLLADGKRALKGDTGVNPIRKTMPPASMTSG